MRRGNGGLLIGLLRILGLAGVDKHENAKAHYWGRLFAWPMLIMAVWLIAQWYFLSEGAISAELGNLVSWLIWLAFVIETVILTSVVNDKKRYLAQNWMNVFIIISAFPVFWGAMPMTALLRALRLLIIPRLIANWWHS
jgi:voltage-gated potassium channel